MSKNINKKNNYYLDVAQYILTEAYQATPSPKILPSPHQDLDVRLYYQQTVLYCITARYEHIFIQIKTPHNLPNMIQFQGNRPSPYLKQLLKNPQIQFYDFTLQGPNQSDFDSYEHKYLHDDAIPQDEAQNEKSQNQQNNQDQMIPVQPSRLNLKTFRAILNEFRNIQLTQEQIRQFVQEYLTQEDMENMQKQVTLPQMISIAEYNLRPVGVISWLQRKNKVNKYLQKKKRRIWNKKINYDCRKKVAQNRLRIKGKFVTLQQACQMLGIRQNASIDHIKYLLADKHR